VPPQICSVVITCLGTSPGAADPLLILGVELAVLLVNVSSSKLLLGGMLVSSQQERGHETSCVGSLALWSKSGVLVTECSLAFAVPHWGLDTGGGLPVSVSAHDGLVWNLSLWAGELA